MQDNNIVVTLKPHYQVGEYLGIDNTHNSGRTELEVVGYELSYVGINEENNKCMFDVFYTLKNPKNPLEIEKRLHHNYFATYTTKEGKLLRYPRVSSLETPVPEGYVFDSVDGMAVLFSKNQ